MDDIVDCDGIDAQFDLLVYWIIVMLG